AMRAILDASMPPQPAPVIRGSRSGKPSARASDLGSPSSQPGPTAPAAPALKVGRSPRPDGARVVPRPMDVRDSWRSKGTAPEASAGGAAPLPEAPKPFRPDPIQGATGPTERVRVRRARLRMAVLYVGLLAVAVIALAFVYRMRLRDSVVIEVQSIPNGATVSLDGREFSQRTPAIIRGGLEPGKEYTLKVSLDGYRALERKFTATDGPNVQIATLEPAVTHVTIDTTPAGARVWVDEVSQGTAPVDLPDVKPGSTLLVRAQASGFRETTQQVRVDVGERDVRIEIALEPKP
ncbi:MAG: PEGA domain-containing protein, partial [Myxococcales bacterium]|nr:PEGA domain-containing protein [Myxococcales bacterium]